MKYGKEFCDIENVWLVGSLDSDMFTTLYTFTDENMADLMLFCLERTVQ